MSDTADDTEFHGRHVLNKAKTEPLRERMRAFIEEHETSDLQSLRERVSEGENLSAVVQENREERL